MTAGDDGAAAGTVGVAAGVTTGVTAGAATGVSVRAMRWWDVEPVAELERDLFGASAWSPETFWSELAQPSRHYLVAQDGVAQDGAGRIVGYGGIGVNGAEADVFTLAVARAAQRRGLGARLLRELIARSAERGATSLMLEVRAGNAAAIGLYRRHGFERIAVRRGYYQPENEDAWVMRLRPLTRVAAGQGTYL